jgi:hypothetical protein
MSDDELTLLSGERVLMSSDGGMLTLTNFRVRLDAKGRGASKYLSITLDAVASCGVVNNARPSLLLLAAVSAIGGVVVNDSSLQVALWVFAGLLVIAYLATRTAMLTISSKGGQSIAVPAKGLGRERIIEFTDAVDAAKLARKARLDFVIPGSTSDTAGHAR